MKPENIKQYQALVEHIRSIGPSTVAFSGGTDSTLLLFAAREALEGNLLAISVRNPYVTGRESDEAEEALAQLDGIRLIRNRLFQRTAYRRSFSEGLGVFEQEPSSKAALEFMDFAAALYPDTHTQGNR